jgi:rhodanese-related sulfurtransferase
MIKTISCAGFKDLLNTPTVKLFDVRDELSYQNSHIEGAEYLPREKFEDVCNHLEKNKTILIYCYKGNRSKIVAQFLLDHGFKNIYNLEGGYSAWLEYVLGNKPSN